MKDLKVRDVMTADPTTLKRNDKLTLADDIMRLARVRHLPVLDDDGQLLVGIVTQRDLFRDALAQALGYGRDGLLEFVCGSAAPEALRVSEGSLPSPPRSR